MEDEPKGVPNMGDDDAPVDARRQAELNARIEANLPLVKHVVFQVAVHFPRHVDREELARAGALGLVEAASGEIPVDDSMLWSDLHPNLRFMTAGRRIGSLVRFFESGETEGLLKLLANNFEYVVFDSAPLLIVPDAELIAPHVGGCIAVLRSRQTRRDSFSKMVAALAPGQLIGSFVNDVRATRLSRQYGYYEDREAAAGLREVCVAPVSLHFHS